MRRALLLVVLLAGCARRTPTPHDGTCLGKASAEFQDCLQLAGDRYSVRTIFAGGNPVYQQQHEIEYQLAVQQCNWNRGYALETCRLRWEMERQRGCAKDADCPGTELCERGACRE